mmetsp:Transcript_10458/g.21519  ORF Transcript_10458/g.21519 Transcript_10458/m.21519 type:complete len:744 (+) Transcript_10458:597-2828(+)
MRPYSRSTSKSTSANRIRERYLHQLGLQRGNGFIGAAGPGGLEGGDQQVIVISGLPSLPEERATTDSTDIHRDVDDCNYAEGLHQECREGENDEVGEESAKPANHGFHVGRCVGSTSQDSHEPVSPLFTPSTTNIAPTPAPLSSITSLALSYPKALLKAPMGMPFRSTSFHGQSSGHSAPSPSDNNKNSSTRSNLSKPAASMLHQDPSASSTNNADHDSVSSNATSTTAESSFSAMVSRDWAAARDGHHSESGSKGVYYQRMGVPSTHSARLKTPPSSNLLVGHHLSQSAGYGSLNSHNHQYYSGNNNASSGPSSLTNALNRFNIDSDCEASVASRCGNSIMTEDDNEAEHQDNNAMDDDDGLSCDGTTASRTSLASAHDHNAALSSSLGSVNVNGNAGTLSSSVGSNATNFSLATNTTANTNASNSSKRSCRKKKIGKAQRLMDRAAAHERILQIRQDRSTKSRMNLVHHQRGIHTNTSSSVSSVEGLNSGVAVKTEPELSSSLGSCSSRASIPLLHVQHGPTAPNKFETNAPTPSLSALAQDLQRRTNHRLVSPSTSHDPLGKTPTASNCTDYTKLAAMTAPPNHLNSILYPELNAAPVGVHISSNSCRDVPLPLSSNLANSSGATDKPLQYHPRLASRIPTPPPRVAFQNKNSSAKKQEVQPEEITSRSKNPTALARGVYAYGMHGLPMQPGYSSSNSNNAGDSMECSEDLSSVDDVLEVAMTLSRLGGSCPGTVIPRLR